MRIFVLNVKIEVMTREDIDNAAYKDACLNHSLTEMAWFVSKTAFKRGAEWRITSIWHDAKETANQKSSILIYNKYGGLQLNYTGYFSNWAEYVKIYRIEKWCYKDDLLPTK